MDSTHHTQPNAYEDMGPKFKGNNGYSSYSVFSLSEGFRKKEILFSNTSHL